MSDQQEIESLRNLVAEKEYKISEVMRANFQLMQDNAALRRDNAELKARLIERPKKNQRECPTCGCTEYNERGPCGPKPDFPKGAELTSFTVTDEFTGTKIEIFGDPKPQGEE